MPNWMITGAGRAKPTKWGGAAGACKTAFKTQVVIKNTEDVIVSYQTEQGEYVWPDIKPGYKIHYVVETGANDEAPASDEFYVQIISMNWPYIISVINDINQTATEAQHEEWDNNEDEFVAYLEAKLDPSKIMLTYSSKLHETDQDGLYRGLIVVPQSWPSGPMNIILAYGYNQDARSGDISRTWENLFDTFTLTVWVTTFIASIVLCGPSGGVGCAVAASIANIVLVGELSVAVYEQYARGYFTQVGRNKYDCSFPKDINAGTGGFVHVYGFLLNNSGYDPFQLIDIQSAEINPVFGNGGFIFRNPRFILTMLIVGGGLFMAIYSMFSGGDSNG